MKQKNNKKEEWIVDNAAQYFFNEGINEEGLAIFIEELELKILLNLFMILQKISELIEAYALTGKKENSKGIAKRNSTSKNNKGNYCQR